MTFRNPELAELVPDGQYRVDDLVRVERALADHQTLTFSRLPSGLFSAAPAGDSIAASGSGNVWLRDNIYVALALVMFFSRYLYRFDGIISGEVDPQDALAVPMFASMVGH
jgi:hypothetical protein